MDTEEDQVEVLVVLMVVQRWEWDRKSGQGTVINGRDKSSLVDLDRIGMRCGPGISSSSSHRDHQERRGITRGGTVEVITSRRDPGKREEGIVMSCTREEVDQVDSNSISGTIPITVIHNNSTTVIVITRDTIPRKASRAVG